MGRTGLHYRTRRISSPPKTASWPSFPLETKQNFDRMRVDMKPTRNYTVAGRNLLARLRLSSVSRCASSFNDAITGAVAILSHSFWSSVLSNKACSSVSLEKEEKNYRKVIGFWKVWFAAYLMVITSGKLSLTELHIGWDAWVDRVECWSTKGCKVRGMPRNWSENKNVELVLQVRTVVGKGGNVAGESDLLGRVAGGWPGNEGYKDADAFDPKPLSCGLQR